MNALDSTRPPSVSMFFPAYNDGGTIGSLVIRAVGALSRLTPDFEVIVVNDGSTDSTRDIVDELTRTYQQVRAIHHPQNRGYGAALRTGFAAATKDLIAYTDGDAQYDPGELEILWARLTPDTDVVTGYKISRSDPWHRIVIGRIYHFTVKYLFRLRVRDVDCDFRLMRRSIFDTVSLESTTGTITFEMVKKIQDTGHRIVEVPVHHTYRQYGQSQFFNFPRVARTLAALIHWWWRLVIKREHLQSSQKIRHRS